jgi:hypothetical protein
MNLLHNIVGVIIFRLYSLIISVISFLSNGRILPIVAALFTSNTLEVTSKSGNCNFCTSCRLLKSIVVKVKFLFSI